MKEISTVFFDRDGVINLDKGYVYKIEDFEWVSGAKEAIIYLKEKGCNIYVVTNQSGVARGFYNEEDVIKLHLYINEQLKEYGIKIDGFYYCPHYPKANSFEYGIECSCRKPEPGLINKAIIENDLIREKSIIIGDKDRDVQAGINAGIEGHKFDGTNLYNFIINLFEN